MMLICFTVLLLIGLTSAVDGPKRIQLLRRVTRKTSGMKKKYPKAGSKKRIAQYLVQGRDDSRQSETELKNAKDCKEDAIFVMRNFTEKGILANAECRKFDLPENGKYIDACNKVYRGVRCKEGYSMTLNTTCIGRKRRTTQTCDDIDECQESPCKNAGTCTNSPGSFSCQCALGYTGETCCIDIDDCSSNPCGDNGVCVDGVNNFTCICVNGYEGVTNCTDIDECQDSPCKNNGTCSNSRGSFSCQCAPGYTGETCCTDIDECSSNPCGDNGVCVDGENDFTCICVNGYGGENCTDIDECQDTPCKNGGTCSNSPGSFSCHCAPGYTGETCCTDIDDCSSNQCGQNAVCVDGVNDFTCICVNGYEGENCTECKYSLEFDVKVDDKPMRIGNKITSEEACEAKCNTTSECVASRFAKKVCYLYRVPFLRYFVAKFESCKNLCSANTYCKTYSQEASDCVLYSATSENLTIRKDVGERVATKLCT